MAELGPLAKALVAAFWEEHAARMKLQKAINAWYRQAGTVVEVNEDIDAFCTEWHRGEVGVAGDYIVKATEGAGPVAKE